MGWIWSARVCSVFSCRGMMAIVCCDKWEQSKGEMCCRWYLVCDRKKKWWLKRLRVQGRAVFCILSRGTCKVKHSLHFTWCLVLVFDVFWNAFETAKAIWMTKYHLGLIEYEIDMKYPNVLSNDLCAGIKESLEAKIRHLGERGGLACVKSARTCLWMELGRRNS